MNLRLHKTLGVNPKMTFCRQCGGDAEELILMGAITDKYQCRGCNTILYGMSICPKCKSQGDKLGDVGEFEKLPASQLCNKCKETNADHAEVVRRGGIHWKCQDCNSFGVIKQNDYTEHVRSLMKIEISNPCGVAFKKNQGCPICSDKQGE